MKIDLHCPLEVCAYTRDDSHSEITIYNLSEHPVCRFDAVICWPDEDGSENLHTYRSKRIYLAGHARKSFSLPPIAADTPDILFRSVYFSDAAPEWRGDPAHVIEVTRPDPADLSTHLRHDRNAVDIPSESIESWGCICGRPNPADAENCTRCGLSRSDVMKAHSLRQSFFLQKKRLILRTISAGILLVLLVIAGIQQSRTRAAAETGSLAQTEAAETE